MLNQKEKFLYYMPNMRQNIMKLIKQQKKLGSCICLIPISRLYSKEGYLKFLLVDADHDYERYAIQQSGIKEWLNHYGYRLEMIETRKALVKVGQKIVSIGEWQHSKLYLKISW